MATASKATTPVGRPRSHSAASHAAILDAVHALLQEKSAREVSMAAVAERAGVGKPTLYKWWPSKTALIFTLVQERIVGPMEEEQAISAEAAIRSRVSNLIKLCNGDFGKVLAELIAEGQSNPTVLSDLYERLIRLRRSVLVCDIERGKLAGEFAAETDPELLIDAIFGPLFYNLLLQLTPLTQHYGQSLVDQVLRGATALRQR
jgi:AcrR family transcriptional regulator